jgi:PAS domain S-box-containing protein
VFAEEKFSNMEDPFQLMVESANEAIAVVQDGGIKYANPKASEITGYSVEEAASTSFIEFVHPDDREKVRTNYQRWVAGRPASPEYCLRLLRRDGEVRCMELKVTAIVWEGKPATLVFLNDITARRNAEEELRREKEKYRILTEESPFALSILTEAGEYEYLNAQFVETFGYTIADVPTGRDWFQKAYPNPDYRNQVVRTWIEDLKRSAFGVSRPRVFTVTCKDGVEKVIHFRPVTLSTGSQMVIYEDITQRKRSEEELSKAKALLSAAIEQSPAGILIADAPDVTIQVANSAALGIRGETSPPLTGISVEHHPKNWQVFHPDGRPFNAEDLPLSQAVLEGRTTRNVDAIIRRPNGEERWILANAGSRR